MTPVDTMLVDTWAWIGGVLVALMALTVLFVTMDARHRRQLARARARLARPSPVVYLEDFAPAGVEWHWPADGSVVPLGPKADVIDLPLPERPRAIVLDLRGRPRPSDRGPTA